MALYTHETSTSFNSDTDTLSVVLPSNETDSASDWIKHAVHLRRFQPAIRKSETRPVRVAPEWITNPTPVYRPTFIKRVTLSALLARCWHSQWQNRDWETTAQFFKTADTDECPMHDIVRLDPTF